MFCKNCGASISNDAEFCPKCGAIQGTRNSNGAPNNYNTISSQPNSNQPNVIPNNHTTVSNKSNNTAVIIGAILVVLVLGVLYFSFFKGNGEVVVLDGMNIYIPKNYEKSTVSGYNNVYISEDNNYLIGTTSYTGVSNLTLNSYMTSYNSGLENSGYDCTSSVIKTINDTEWGTMICSYDDLTSYIYVGIKDGKLYLATVASQNGDNSKLQKTVNQVEENLKIVE